MSFTSKVIEQQLQGLLKQVEQHRLIQCKEILDKAQRQAKKIFTEAHRNARRRIHIEIEEERKEVRRKISAARAQLQTRQKQRNQQADQALLELAWQALETQLGQRWNIPTQRQQWIEKILLDARRLLIGRHWSIQHAPDLTDEERNNLIEEATSFTGHAPQLRSDDTIQAGLRVCVDGACINGTIEGLMSDQDYLESVLLLEIHNT